MPKPASRRRQPKPVRPLTGMVSITRQVHFNSAHRLFNPAKSLAWNRKHYGLCTNPNWHGHNYILEVAVEGPIDERTGYVIDLSMLMSIVQRERVAVDGAPNGHYVRPALVEIAGAVCGVLVAAGLSSQLPGVMPRTFKDPFNISSLWRIFPNEGGENAVANARELHCSRAIS